ncbi:phosphate acyltransferase PlsX [Pleionea sp. CnH1-48]|uniref:phosphate acyltransferase PlsX n=1 Tax=Pleionea sp. CnH1-48 TaxID=2954494 RepID=UPI002096AE87|nr:phosphate acyltransferase PlsX [Pleionea sp. CnH1-48]MCO7225864.1 phosphate acyltransferase PlsX [Pleionea sp. CnH1-48]
MKTITLAIDCMGGDYGPPISVGAALIALEQHPHLHLKLFGDQDRIKQELSRSSINLSQRVTICPTSDVVLMDDKPSVALRSKRDSSMRKAIEAVRDGEADACVSAGNTGALMALSRFIIKMLPGIDRPAIITAIPTANGHTHMLDLGANIDCDSETLFQFGIMGSVLASAIHNIPRPTVGLLNIGEEEIKGNDQVKQAAVLLQSTSHINYIGFIEGNDIFAGKCDVVVTDGFTGNNVLKASEGVVRLLASQLRSVFERNRFYKLVGLMIKPILKTFKDEIDPDKYNGATLIGLKGIVIKSHGGASITATVNAINEAITEVEKNVPQRIAQEVENLLIDRS